MAKVLKAGGKGNGSKNAAKNADSGGKNFAKRKRWSEVEIETALAKYAETGNLTLAAKSVGAVPSTMDRWLRRQDPEQIQRARMDQRVKAVEKGYNVIHKYLDHLMEDEVVSKADAFKSAGVVGHIVEKIQLLQGKPTAIEHVDGQVTHEHEHRVGLTLRTILEQRGGTGGPPSGDPLPALLRRGTSLAK